MAENAPSNLGLFSNLSLSEVLKCVSPLTFQPLWVMFDSAQSRAVS